MRRWAHLLAPVFLMAAVASCAPGEEGEVSFSAPAGEIPVTSTSDEALHHFAEGQQAMDAGRFIEANKHFEQAVQADPAFAYGYLNAANSATSLEEFKTNLDEAAANAETADEGVRLLIQIGQKGLNSDVEGQLETANQLVEMYPESPRAWLTLAGIQTGLNDNEAARASMEKALEVNAEFAPAYEALRSSYLFSEPIDLGKAEENARRVIELTPEESNAHENLGDVLRARGRLDEARTAYAQAAELNTADAVPVLKMGHIDSFLGNYDQARAEYDEAIGRAREGERATFPNYRAFTWVHEGKPETAVEELGSLVTAIDDMGLAPDEAVGAKIFTLTNEVQIAIHHRMFDVARTALEQRAALMRGQTQIVGTEEFRRGQEADIALWNGILAAETGEYEAAQQAVATFSTLVEETRNPRAMEPAHYLMGLIALRQGDAAGAIPHLEQAVPGNMYMKYQLAVAQEMAGNAEEARRLFGEVAEFNFNSVNFALVRKTALEKVGETEEGTS
ncbi:MAG: tetratricopeptide repeat protein [Gemmatimonadota bacterium]